MQKPIKFFLSLLCLPGLVSCDSDNVSWDKGNGMKVMMTDTFQLYNQTNAFSAIGLPTNADDIIYRIEHGENVLFAFTQEDCPSCESLMKNAGHRLWETKYRISYIDKDTKEAAEKISKYAVDNGLERTLAHPISGSTPSMYVMSKERIVELIYGSNSNDEKVITAALREHVTKSNVHHYRVNAWGSSLNRYDASLEGFTYVLSEASKDDFYTNVFPIVSESDKRFNIIELYASDKDSVYLAELRGYAGMDDVEGKLLYVDVADTSKNKSENTIDIIHDVESYLKTHYANSSSSL